jgi:nucleotide-binding universal stress UspA family protein
MPSANEDAAAAAHALASEETDPLARSAVGVERRSTAPIVVAVDGSRAAGAALRVAAALADRDRAPVEAVLLEGIAPSGSGMSLCADVLRQASLAENTRLGRVRRQLCAILETHAWNLHVEFGSFGPAVTNVARSTDAWLIVLGLTRQRPARRLLGSGAVARVLQSAQIPVLAVAATARELPHVAVAAIDFSPASLRAARVARDLLARPGTLHLVHVRAARAERASEIEGWGAVAEAGVSLKLEELASELAADGVSVVAKLASGALIGALLGATRDVSAELIACGAHSVSAIDRFLVGHVPLELLQRVECSMLLAPSAAPTPNQP